MPLAGLVARRMLHTVVVLLATSFLVFTLVHVSGDPLAVLRASPGSSAETLRGIAQRRHLDEPLIAQYLHWLRTVFSDGFGTTLLGDQPIWPSLRRALVNSAQIVVPALALGGLGGVLLGTCSAVRRRSLLDHAGATFSFTILAMPQFWLALLLQVLFTNLYLSTGVRVVYTSGLTSPDPGNVVIDRLQHLALPVVVLAALVTAFTSRFVRSSVLEVLGGDHVRTAEAKGLRRRPLLVRHVFVPALPPIVAVLAASVPLVLGGTVVIESVFSIDGFGRYLLRALAARDAYPIMASLTVTSAVAILCNLIADLSHAYLDPRVRDA